MDFEAFMESIKKHIKEYLPESYQDAQVTIREQQKLNNRYMGLTVIRPGDDRIPTINLTDLFRQSYENPRFRITDVLEQISQIIQREPERFDVSRLTQYEEAKKHLFMRVSNADKNAQVLGGVPFVEREDLAITFHIAVEETEAGRASAIVTNRMMETYGVTRNQLYKDSFLAPIFCFPELLIAYSIFFPQSFLFLQNPFRRVCLRRLQGTWNAALQTLPKLQSQTPILRRCCLVPAKRLHKLYFHILRLLRLSFFRLLYVLVFPRQMPVFFLQKPEELLLKALLPGLKGEIFCRTSRAIRLIRQLSLQGILQPF